MKAIELKINNWVTINDPDWANLKGLPFKVIGINSLLESNKPSDDYVITVCDFYGTYKIYNEFIEGILITPEILVKAGFVKYDWMDGYFIKTKFGELMVQFYKDEIHTYFTNIGADSQGMKMRGRSYIGNLTKTLNITYVHKLQKFIYEITGEELPIEL